MFSYLKNCSSPQNLKEQCSEHLFLLLNFSDRYHLHTLSHLHAFRQLPPHTVAPSPVPTGMPSSTTTSSVPTVLCVEAHCTVLKLTLSFSLPSCTLIAIFLDPGSSPVSHIAVGSDTLGLPQAETLFPLPCQSKDIESPEESRPISWHECLMIDTVSSQCITSGVHCI